MSSHLPLLFYLNLIFFHFNFTLSLQFLKNPTPLKLLSLRLDNGEDKMSSFLLAVGAPGPTPPARTSTLGPSSAACPTSSVTSPASSAVGLASAAAGASSIARAVAGPSVPASAASAAPTAVQGATAADSRGSFSLAPAQRRYYTRVGRTPPALSHPRPIRRAPPPKRTETSGPRESSTSRSRRPPSSPYQGIAGAPDISPASIIRRPHFPCDPISGNVSCKGKDFHGEVYYDLPAFSTDPELRDSMLLVQRYHQEPFIVPRQFFYPRVVIEFYHTMTSRREANLTALHFSIDGRPGILRASNITVTLHLPVVLANADDYRQWPHPLTREMVRLLSMDATGGTILFRRHLPQCMLLIDHILRSNMFPLQHIVQRRGAILEVLYHISEGYWFSPVEMIMTLLFHFENRIHHRSLPRTESIPLLFPRLLCQVLEHIGFPAEP